MKPKDIFQLAVRILGLIFLYQGLTALPSIAPVIFTAFFGGQIVGFMAALLVAVWPLAIAYWLMRGAQFIMCLAYPDTMKTSEPEIGEVRGQRVDV